MTRPGSMMTQTVVRYYLIHNFIEDSTGIFSRQLDYSNRLDQNYLPCYRHCQKSQQIWCWYGSKWRILPTNDTKCTSLHKINKYDFFPHYLFHFLSNNALFLIVPFLVTLNLMMFFYSHNTCGCQRSKLSQSRAWNQQMTKSFTRENILYSKAITCTC